MPTGWVRALKRLLQTDVLSSGSVSLPTVRTLHSEGSYLRMRTLRLSRLSSIAGWLCPLSERQSTLCLLTALTRVAPKVNCTLLAGQCRAAYA